jgi:putative PIG3 family NAD(P)H quinone oxidoreductase
MSIFPTTMPAVEIASPGGPEQLRLVSRPVPAAGEDEVLIRVLAAGVNRPDVMQRQGKYAAPPGASDIPGLEVAGEIVAIGSKVQGLAVRDRVTALLAGGGYAGFAVAAAGLCLPIPDGFSMLEAAALPETVFTVWSNLFERGGCKSGDNVLVHGGTSGIGTMAIQLAATLGARVFATAGGPEKARACEKLGAARGIDYRTEDFVEVVLKQTNGAGADVILDMVAGAYVPRNMRVAAPFARIVSIAALGGARAEVDVSVIMHKRLTLTGSTLRSRPLAQKAALAESVRHSVWPLLSAGRVRPVLHATFPLAEAAAAHQLMETSSHIGKIMLSV